MDIFEEMLKMFPHMILISKSPTTWKGVLTVADTFMCSEIKVKLKVVVPLFPQLDNTLIYFGGNIAFLFGTKFKKQIDSLIKNSESVPCFFQDLKTTIENMICDSHNGKNSNNLMQVDNREKLLKELDSVLTEYSDVEFLATKDLSTIKLSLNDITMIVQPTINSTGQNCWKIISSDLPELPCNSNNEKKLFTLKEIRNLLQKQVNTLEDVWNELRKIDNFCSVIDPINPKPYHLYRRIYLSPSLSFLLTLNPVDPTGYPKIKFLGAKNEVEKYRDMIQDEDVIDKWDLEYSVYENLLTLLNIDDFPQPPKNDNSFEEDGMVGDDECCICFSTQLEGGELPDEICNDQRCRKYFHSTCLFQWLQELATNKIVFNKIFGPCPNCGQKVSCNVPTK